MNKTLLAIGDSEDWDSFLKFQRQGHISNRYVLPAHRKKGIATKLTRELLKWFRKKKIRDIHLGVFSKNSPAQKTFAKLGFKSYIIEMEKHLQ